MPNEQQKDEIIALESIYTKEEFSFDEVDGQYHCTLKIFVNLPDGYQLIYKDKKNEQDVIEKIPISHLPPLTLLVSLPNDYPADKEPNFTICCSWLRVSSLQILCKKLDDLWLNNKGQEIIFTWIAFLQNEILDCLHIETFLDVSFAHSYYQRFCKRQEKCEQQHFGNHGIQSDEACKKVESRTSRMTKKKFNKKPKKIISDKRAIFTPPLNGNLVQALLDYNEERMCIEFKKNFYSCKICFADKSGESCTQFKPCLHIFCKECITGYLEVRIKDGAVQNICCPEDNCTSEASPGQIKELISPELFTQYDTILLSVTLDTMLDIVYCPRRHCQYPVSTENNEKMANCPSCGYVFCIYCKMVYHGIEPCKVTSVEKMELVHDYQNSSDARKLYLENRYGKQQLQTLVENTMSENWINKNSQNCPQCNAAIEKTDGCNKMTCGRCNTFFCWICQLRLNRETPYVHYQNPQSKCYSKLYEGMVVDGDDDDDDWDEEDFLIDLDL